MKMPWFFACYDSKTNKIYNCVEGSKTWWHERGHQVQAEKGYGLWQEFAQYVFVPFAVLCLAIGVSIIALVLMIFWLAIDIWLEFDAWAYALKHKNEWKIGG